VRHLALLAKRYDVYALKRFAPAKRQAMLACFLVEAERNPLDQLVEMHDQYLTTMWRRARQAFEGRHRRLRRRARDGVETVLLAIYILLAAPVDGTDVRAQVTNESASNSSTGQRKHAASSSVSRSAASLMNCAPDSPACAAICRPSSASLSLPNGVAKNCLPS
jgi:hypothetical protein